MNRVWDIQVDDFRQKEYTARICRDGHQPNKGSLGISTTSSSSSSVSTSSESEWMETLKMESALLLARPQQNEPKIPIPRPSVSTKSVQKGFRNTHNFQKGSVEKIRRSGYGQGKEFHNAKRSSDK